MPTSARKSLNLRIRGSRRHCGTLRTLCKGIASMGSMNWQSNLCLNIWWRHSTRSSASRCVNDYLNVGKARELSGMWRGVSKWTWMGPPVCRGKQWSCTKWRQWPWCSTKRWAKRHGKAILRSQRLRLEHKPHTWFHLELQQTQNNLLRNSISSLRTHPHNKLHSNRRSQYP